MATELFPSLVSGECLDSTFQILTYSSWSSLSR